MSPKTERAVKDYGASMYSYGQAVMGSGPDSVKYWQSKSAMALTEALDLIQKEISDERRTRQETMC